MRAKNTILLRRTFRRALSSSPRWSLRFCVMFAAASPQSVPPSAPSAHTHSFLHKNTELHAPICCVSSTITSASYSRSSFLSPSPQVGRYSHTDRPPLLRLSVCTCRSAAASGSKCPCVSVKRIHPDTRSNHQRSRPATITQSRVLTALPPADFFCAARCWLPPTSAARSKLDLSCSACLLYASTYSQTSVVNRLPIYFLRSAPAPAPACSAAPACCRRAPPPSECAAVAQSVVSTPQRHLLSRH